jgi:hypothetical protein
VGIDGPKEELLSQVVHDPSQQLKILSIVGFGGLGKTTLANAVYREIGGEFNCTAFVSVSQKPTMRTVLYGLLSKLTGNTSPLDTGSVEELISKLARWGPIPLLSFPVLLHLDYAIDYRPPSRAAPLPMASGPRRTSSTGGRACATATMGPFLSGCCLGIASSSGVIARRRLVMTQARCRTLHSPRSVQRRTVPPGGALGPTGAGGGAGSGAGGAGQGRGRHVAAVTNPGCGAPLPRGQAGPWTQILRRTAARRKTPNLCPPL